MINIIIILEKAPRRLGVQNRRRCSLHHVG